MSGEVEAASQFMKRTVRVVHVVLVRHGVHSSWRPLGWVVVTLLLPKLRVHTRSSAAHLAGGD